MDESIALRARGALRALVPARTQEELARRIGMTPDALSRALNGKRHFASVELARLAEVTGVSMYWLATGERDPFELTLAARHQFDQGTREHRAENLESARPFLRQLQLVYKQARKFLSATADLPPLNAATVREVLPEDFVFDFATQVEKNFGVDVIRVADVNGAFSVRVADQYVIVLGQSSNWFYQNWSTAHELAHLLSGHLGEEEISSSAHEREALANEFAADLLMPESEIRKSDWRQATPESVAALLWRLGVSAPALRTRLSALNIETNDRVAGLLTQSTQAVLARNGVDPTQISERMQRASRRRFPLRLLTALREAVESGDAPKATLSWVLALRDTDVEVEEPARVDALDLDALAAELELNG